MKRFVRTAISVALPFAFLASANAQTTTPNQPAKATDPEERLDEGLKGFGYLAGLARNCVSSTQQTELEREVLDLHSSISRLLGTDRAFLFSTSFGYGTSVKVETKDCAEILKNYEARVAKHRAASGNGK